MKRTSITTIIMTALFLGLLSGCEQYYRYPCQDPENWDTDACKRPLCEVNRDCPDLIFQEEERSRPVMPSMGTTTCDRRSQ